MAPRKLVYAKNGNQTPVNSVDESSDEEVTSDSNRGKALKKPKSAARPGVEPATEENGSTCSSPTTSGFIIKPRGKKKTPASKIFSDAEVIALLKGLALFWSSGRNNKWAEFYEFIKGDFGYRYSKSQVSEKVRSLRKKFERTRANGPPLDFSDPHESLVFQLSEVLWGDDSGAAQENGKSGGLSSRNSRMREQLVAPAEEEDIAEKQNQEDEHGDRAGESHKKSRKREQLDAPAEEENVAEKPNQEDEHGENGKRAGVSHKKSRKKEQLDAPGKQKQEEEHGENGKRAGESRKKSRKIEQLYAPAEEENVVEKQKQEDEHGNNRKRAEVSHKKSRKREQLDTPAEGENGAEKQKQEDGHGESRKGAVESLKKSRKRKQLDAPAEEEKKQEDEHGESRKRALESHKKSRKRKQLDEEENIAEEQNEENEHDEENHTPEKGKQVKEYGIEEFQSDFPLLYASFDEYGFPTIATEKCILIPRQKAQELEEKWREMDADISRLELKRIELIKRDLEDRLQTK